MFTIIENYKTLMKMCVSAELAPTEHVVAAVEAEAADGSNSFTLQDLNKVVADLNASHPGADHESQVLAVLKNKFDVNLGWEVLNKMNNLSNQATQVEAQGQVGQAIHAQEVQQAVPNANSMATMPTNYETLQTAMPVYTTEQFIAPSVDTFNGQRVTQLNYLSQPIDGSQLVIGNYYRSEINEIMEYRGGCFTVKSGPVVLPGISTGMAKTFQGECTPQACPALDTYVPLQAAPQIVHQPFTPYVAPAPEPTPPTRFEVNCNGEQIPGDFVVRCAGYDVYVAEDRVFRVNQITGKVEQRNFGIDEGVSYSTMTPEHVRNNIHRIMIEGSISIGFIKLGDLWEHVGDNDNVCTAVLPDFGGGDGVGNPTGNPGTSGDGQSSNTGTRGGGNNGGGGLGGGNDATR